MTNRKVGERRKRSRNVRECHAAFEAALPRIVRHCQIQFRGVRCQSAREELTAEAVGLAWKWFARLWERGKDPSRFVSAIATFAVKAARSGRRVAGSERAKDAMSPRAQRLKGFSVCKLPDFATLAGNPIAEALISNTLTPVDEQVQFRFDFAAWLAGWDAHRRQILDLMLQGERTKDIADKVGKSSARISQLRDEFSLSWFAFLNGEE
jgi:hypothetical protein